MTEINKVEPQSSEYTKEEFITKFKGMETDLKEIKDFMGNILKAVEEPRTPKEPKKDKVESVKKDWIEEFFGVD